MKKPIRDNWHNVSIVVCVFFIMSFCYIFYITFIRPPVTVVYLNSVKRLLLLNILF